MEIDFLKPGDLKTTTVPARYTTILGSCVSVCLFDTKTHRAGMNHFIFPKDNRLEATDDFGDISTVHLIEYMLKNGCTQRDIVASVIGGASSFSLKNSESAGNQNISVAKKVLNDWDIKIQFEETGGCHGRKVVYLTDSNEFKITKLHDCLGLCKNAGKVCHFRIKKS